MIPRPASCSHGFFLLDLESSLARGRVLLWQSSTEASSAPAAELAVGPRSDHAASAGNGRYVHGIRRLRHRTFTASVSVRPAIDVRAVSTLDAGVKEHSRGRLRLGVRKKGLIQQTLVPRRAFTPSMRVGLRTSELGCRAFSSIDPVHGATNNGNKRGNTRLRSVTAAGPFRIRTGFPVRRPRQAAEPGHPHLVTWWNLIGSDWTVSRREQIIASRQPQAAILAATPSATEIVADLVAFGR